MDGPWWLRASDPFRDLVSVHAQATVEVIRGATEGRAAAAEVEATAAEEVVVEAEATVVEAAVAAEAVTVAEVVAAHPLALRVAAVRTRADKPSSSMTGEMYSERRVHAWKGHWIR